MTAGHMHANMFEKGFLKVSFSLQNNIQPLRHVPFYSYSRHEDEVLYPSPPGIPLTAGEDALIKSIFGDGIKTEDIRKYFSPAGKPGADEGYIIPAQTFGVDCIKFYGPEYTSKDYSKTKDIFKYGTFIHEMTHIWQNQQRSHGNTVHSNQAQDDLSYTYALTEQTHFEDLGEEQQAKVIEDYAREFLYLKHLPVRKTDKYLPSYAQDGNAAQLHDAVLLKKIVEDTFPQARKTRLALEARLTAKHRHKPKL